MPKYKPEDTPLTKEQAIFVNEYVRTGNAAAAYILAVQTRAKAADVSDPDKVKKNANFILGLPQVQKSIATKRADQAVDEALAKITADDPKPAPKPAPHPVVDPPAQFEKAEAENASPAENESSSDVTVDWLIENQRKVYDEAMRSKQFSAANAALREIAKLKKFVEDDDPNEVHGLTGRTEAELMDILATRVGQTV
jgi:phage terminase small subunit